MTSNVVLGLGGGVDYELDLSPPILEQLVSEYRIRDAELTSSAMVATENGSAGSGVRPIPRLSPPRGSTTMRRQFAAWCSRRLHFG